MICPTAKVKIVQRIKEIHNCKESRIETLPLVNLLNSVRMFAILKWLIFVHLASEATSQLLHHISLHLPSCNLQPCVLLQLWPFGTSQFDINILSLQNILKYEERLSYIGHHRSIDCSKTTAATLRTIRLLRCPW